MVKIKASLIAKGTAIKTETWIGDGHFMVKQDQLSEVNRAQIMAKGERDAQVTEDSANSLIGTGLKDFKLSSIILKDGPFESLCFYCELTDEVLCIDRKYESLVSPVMSSNGGPLSNEEGTVIIAPLRGSVFTEKAEELKIVADLAAKLSS